VLVRGGKVFFYKLQGATGMSRPVLLSQEGESKPHMAKDLPDTRSHQHGVSFFW